MTVRVLHGDSREVLRTFADASIDSVVCDPPYALVSIVKRFGSAKPETEAYAASNPVGVYRRASAGFMGKTWDTGETAFDPAFWAEVLRVLKPGGHLVAFGGTRTYHRLACAIEDAGFEIRDMLSWIFGSGFPKSHNVSKGIDRHLGADRETVRVDNPRIANMPTALTGASRPWLELAKERGYHEKAGDSPATAAAAAWDGWGTALKPALEPICFARRPLIGTVAANVLEHGTGALNIDACRVESGDNPQTWSTPRGGIWQTDPAARGGLNVSDRGRWPANVIHDGSPEVLAGFPDGGAFAPVRGTEASNPTDSIFGDTGRVSGAFHSDSGSAARFFYSPKADAADRLESKHPTVKPVDLMAWLIKLVTPPGGLCLDPFAGSGTTGMAAMREGFDCVLIERESEYVADINRRLAHVGGDDLPLFSGTPQSAQADLFEGGGAGRSTGPSQGTDNRADGTQVVSK